VIEGEGGSHLAGRDERKGPTGKDTQIVFEEPRCKERPKGNEGGIQIAVGKNGRLHQLEKNKSGPEKCAQINKTRLKRGGLGGGKEFLEQIHRVHPGEPERNRKK